MTPDAERAGGVAEAPGNLLGGERLDEIGAQGLILTLAGGGGPHLLGQLVKLPWK